MNIEPAEPRPDTDTPSTEADTPPQSPPRRPGLPAWTLGLLVLVLTAVLVWAGNALIRSRQQSPTPTPLPAPSATMTPPATPTQARTAAPTATSIPTPAAAEPAEPDETLVLVADLYSPASGPKPDADLTELFYETLVARIEEADLESQVRVEQLGEAVENADVARAAGQAQNATHVLWGRAPEPGAETNLAQVALTRVKAARVETPPRTRTTSHGYDLTLSVLGQHDLQVPAEQKDWVDGAVDVFLAIAAYGRLAPDAAEPFWNKALDAAQQIEAPDLAASIHLYRGNARAFDGDMDGALAEYDAAIELAPDLSPAYVNRGSVRNAQGDDRAALDDLNRAIELDPDAANAYYARATVYRAQEQAEETLADLDRALELDPQHARAYASRALIHHNAGDHEAALEDYTRALELDPEAGEVYLNRGGTYATLGQFEAALDDYTRAIELNPDDADAYYNRGTVYAMLSAYGQALADLDRALALKPGFSQIYGNRGLVYKAMGETEKAIADLERFLELSDNPQWREMIEPQLAELKGE